MKDFTDVIIAPVITEKAAIQAEANIYTFKVAKDADIPEKNKLEFLKEIGMCQLRIGEGVATLIQLLGLVARLCNQ